jgi:serine/threonine protein phosphatase 1
MLTFWRSRKGMVKPQLPEGVRIYAISDIHGCADLLEQLFTVIDADLERSRPPHPIQVFLGDYVDRGPESRRTLDLLIERSKSHHAVFLKGNHEAYLLDVLDDPAKFQDWRKYGGLQTLISYGLTPSLNPDLAEQVELMRQLKMALPEAHKGFLKRLRLTFTCGDFFFVHAGVRPGIRLSRQREADLLWIRDAFLESEENFGKYIVHGHTPVREPDIRPNRINIDTGAYATGNLTLLTVQGSSILAL